MHKSALQQELLKFDDTPGEKAAMLHHRYGTTMQDLYDTQSMKPSTVEKYWCADEGSSKAADKYYDTFIKLFGVTAHIDK